MQWHACLHAAVYVHACIVARSHFGSRHLLLGRVDVGVHRQPLQGPAHCLLGSRLKAQGLSASIKREPLSARASARACEHRSHSRGLAAQMVPGSSALLGAHRAFGALSASRGDATELREAALLGRCCAQRLRAAAAHSGCVHCRTADGSRRRESASRRRQGAPDLGGLSRRLGHRRRRL